MSHSANYTDRGPTTVFYQGRNSGIKEERERIIELLEYEASEWLSHHGTCDCKARGEEVLRLISKIEDSDQL